MEGRAGNHRFPKLEIPDFEGKNPRSWVRKCEKYFRIFDIQEWQKIEIAALFLHDKADVWINEFLMHRPCVSWNDFSDALCEIFGEK